MRAKATGTSRAPSRTRPRPAVRAQFQSVARSAAARPSLGAADGQADQRRRDGRPRLAQQVRELEHVGDLLADPRPEAVERHRQGQVVEAAQPAVAGPARIARAMASPTRLMPSRTWRAVRPSRNHAVERAPGPPPTATVAGDGVERELEGHLEPQPPAQPAPAAARSRACSSRSEPSSALGGRCLGGHVRSRGAVVRSFGL